MSISPIDMRTLLMQLNQASKEQSAQKSIADIQDSIKKNVDEKKIDEKKESILEPESPDGPANIKEDLSMNNSEEQSLPDDNKNTREKTSESEIVKDINLGNKIDFSG